MEECPRIYAELLPNIRQITIYISFPAVPASSPAPSTKCSVTLSDVSDGLRLCYGDRTVECRLPARVTKAAAVILKACQLPEWPWREAKEVSFRIPADLSSQEEENIDAHNAGYLWSAKDMTSGTIICCRNCRYGLLDENSCKDVTWKDLPSADWAELMELWHCHKPDNPHEEHEHDVNGNVKGYGASNKVVCTSGTVLIDVTSFYAAEQDCSVTKEMTLQSTYGLASDTTAQYQNPRALFSETLGIWSSSERYASMHWEERDLLVSDVFLASRT
ncbi:hypothetical protein KEM56_004387 [Ascosphaera pollenicola]|nr:hypothetical protein KEM56_004387 [Ascosphaera pollenicola]